MPPHVTCQLMGGLGNQLFIIAAALAYAQEHRLPCALPADYAGMTGADGSARPVYWDTLLSGLKPLLQSYPEHEAGLQPLKEPACFGFAPLPPPQAERMHLTGYFQHLHYTEGQWPAVKAQLGLAQLQGDTRHDAIGLHFRLGDYQLLRHLYPAMTLTYYAEALQHVATVTQREDWAVHYALQEADDVHVAPLLQGLRENFPRMRFQRIAAELADWQQFLHLSCCRHVVTANSTFSWWAARLNRHDDAVVVCPRQWVHGQPVAEAIVPAAWTIVDTAPKVSVIIPTFNRFAALQRTIQSIQQQTHTNLEVIVVDDASTEEAYGCHDWGAQGVLYVRLPQCSKATFGFPCPGGYQRNFGLRLATGSYVAFCDDDDVWLPHKLSMQLQAMQETGCRMSSTESWVGHGPYHPAQNYTRLVAEQTLPHLQYQGLVTDGLLPRIWTQEFLAPLNSMICSSVVIERDIVHATGDFIVACHSEDYDYWKRALKHTDSVFVSQPCMYYDAGHAGAPSWQADS